MKKGISIFEISSIAWQYFEKEKFSWILLAGFALLFTIVGVIVSCYMPEYTNLIAIVLSFFSAFYTAILHQNGLDAVYERKLSMLHVTPSILFGSLFFIAISIYKPIPAYTEFLLLIFPEDFYFLLTINWIIHLCISYLLMRCMFVGMIILEKKSTVKDAFMQSFIMTEHRVLSLFITFLYLNIILFISSLTIIGYFIALPYTILMKALLFQQLYEKMKA